MIPRIRLGTLALCAVAALHGGNVAAAEPVEPALEPNAAVLAKLEALGENEACVLEDTRIVEDLATLRRAGTG